MVDYRKWEHLQVDAEELEGSGGDGGRGASATSEAELLAPLLTALLAVLDLLAEGLRRGLSAPQASDLKDLLARLTNETMRFDFGQLVAEEESSGRFVPPRVLAAAFKASGGAQLALELSTSAASAASAASTASAAPATSATSAASAAPATSAAPAAPAASAEARGAPLGANVWADWRSARELLFAAKDALPAVSRYFLPAAARDDPGLAARIAAAPAATGPAGTRGLFDFDNEEGRRGNFSVFVPEHAAEKPLAVCVALHPARAHGQDSLWRWIDAVRARDDVMLVAPTAYHARWPTTDMQGLADEDYPNLVKILAEISSRWDVDASRVLVTGHFDGGAYAWLCGLRTRSVFTHIAPLATEPVEQIPSVMRLVFMHLRGTHTVLKDKPVYLVIGKQDHYLTEDQHRSISVLNQTGVRLTCVEKEDLGHTFPFEETCHILQWLLDTAPESTTGPAPVPAAGIMEAARDLDADPYL
ncbi:hypothetical protein AB1Y20_003509 [Prymnesium parvum]|uniref:Phospholipase/carboxylesterase/thioesterase domain-containing protein n=1 Tax=Prymnesium parvum TaxID=97485 RepID=A0AB34J4X7_PRYPA